MTKKAKADPVDPKDFITVKLDHETAMKIRKTSEDEDRPVSAQMRRIIDAGMKALAKRAPKPAASAPAAQPAAAAESVAEPAGEPAGELVGA